MKIRYHNKKFVLLTKKNGALFTKHLYFSGWAFVEFILNGKNTFSGFVNCYNQNYARSDPNDQLFMSNRVFIDWFFAWASHMRIDFRQSCRMCNGRTRVVACDGTKLGIGFKHTFVTPIETPTKESGAKLTTKRLDRCYISNPASVKNEEISRRYAQARRHLLNLCKAIKMSDEKFFTDPKNVELSENLISYLPAESMSAYEKMVSSDTPDKLRFQYASVFALLGHDSCIDVVIPYRECSEVIDYCRFVYNNQTNVEGFFLKMKHYCVEFSDLLRFSSKFNEGCPTTDILILLNNCAERVRSLHELDIAPDVPNVIPGTYNPAKLGRAYYFTPHGCQVREMRKFPADKNAKHNYDDMPSQKCNKIFPQVSKKGTSYLFLWFCPIHGHCLGYHVIPGSEGRKDAAASLYTHLPEAPEEIFYDFACSLSEYNHNRESGYFSNTRYYHDVFHGFTHKCSKGFRSDRLLGFNGLNTSICEQFNSFVQNIKTSSKLMTQSHFSFFLQFFINIWNEKKFASFQERIRIAKCTDE